jgi:restriction system protein
VPVSSYWDALRDDRERRRRAQRKAERQFHRAAAAEERRAERIAAGTDRAQRAEQARREREDGEAEAAQRNAELDEEITRLTEILPNAARLPPRTPARLRDAMPPVDPEPDDEPPPRPEWSQYRPPEPRWLRGRGHQRALADAQARFSAAQQRFDRLQDERLEARRRRVAARIAEAQRAHRARWEVLTTGLDAGDPDAIREVAAAILGAVPSLAELLTGGDAVYQPHSRELVIEVDLPDTEVIPSKRSWRYVHQRREVVPQDRPVIDTARRYADLVSQLTLAALDGCFRGFPPETVDAITINGRVPTVDPATGRPDRPCLITVTTSRETFAELDLAHPRLDPARCLRTLGAQLSRHPYELEHIPPFVDFDLARYRLATGPEALADVDHRMDLLTMDAFEFERLVKDLFDRMGYRAWRTQSSRDFGIDAVAVREDPVTPVECLIQTKRYRHRVGPEVVRELIGVLQVHPGATHGVLVTTSWLSDKARQSARAQRIRTIEHAELTSLIKQHLGREVLISNSPPRRGDQAW